MNITSYHTETIIIENPSKKLQKLIQQMREHKRIVREKMRNATPLYVVKA